MTWGLCRRRNSSHSLPLVGRVRSRDSSWRKGHSRLSIKGEARISLAMGEQEAMGISKGRDGKAGTEAPK